LKKKKSLQTYKPGMPITTPPASVSHNVQQKHVRIYHKPGRPARAVLINRNNTPRIIPRQAPPPQATPQVVGIPLIKLRPRSNESMIDAAIRPSEEEKTEQESPGPQGIAGTPEEKAAKKKFVGDIMDTVNSLFWPTIAWQGWESAYPKDLKDRMQQIRLLHSIQDPEDFKVRAHDFEALGFLMTATLAGPASDAWGKVYMYLFTKYMRWKKVEIPDPTLIVETLDSEQERMLDHLKRWIRTTQRKEMERRRKEEK
jgi:hypothetical protein